MTKDGAECKWHALDRDTRDPDSEDLEYVGGQIRLKCYFKNSFGKGDRHHTNSHAIAASHADSSVDQNSLNEEMLANAESSKMLEYILMNIQVINVSDLLPIQYTGKKVQATAAPVATPGSTMASRASRMTMMAGSKVTQAVTKIAEKVTHLFENKECSPYVQLIWNGKEVGCTTAMHNTTSPEWEDAKFTVHTIASNLTERVVTAEASSDLSNSDVSDDDTEEEGGLTTSNTDFRDLKGCELKIMVWDSSKLIDHAKGFSGEIVRLPENVDAFLGCR